MRPPGRILGPAAMPGALLADLLTDLERPSAPADDVAIRIVHGLAGPIAARSIQRSVIARIDHIAARLGGAHDGAADDSADDEPGQEAAALRGGGRGGRRQRPG